MIQKIFLSVFYSFNELITFENKNPKAMKQIKFFFAFFLFSFFSIMANAQENTDEKMVFAIKGKVFDAESKKPIANASVKLKGSDGSVIEIHTSKKGTFVFDEKAIKGEYFVLPNTRYTVIINAPGYEESQQEEDTAVAEESTTFQVDFAMRKIQK